MGTEGVAMNKEIALEDRAEARADQDAEQVERSVRHVPRIDKVVFEKWMKIAKMHEEKPFSEADKSFIESFVTGLDALTEFVRDIDPKYLPPQMRVRRDTLIRRLWGE